MIRKSQPRRQIEPSTGSTFPMRGPKFNDDPAEVYVPMSFTREERQGFGNMFNYSVVARLKPGVTMAQADQESNEDLGENVNGEFRTLTIAVRTRNTPTGETPAVERTIHRLDAALPIDHVTAARLAAVNPVEALRAE